MVIDSSNYSRLINHFCYINTKCEVRTVHFTTRIIKHDATYSTIAVVQCFDSLRLRPSSSPHDYFRTSFSISATLFQNTYRLLSLEQILKDHFKTGFGECFGGFHNNTHCHSLSKLNLIGCMFL